ncbi:MAG: hypothetical protein IKI75_11280 [Lachnospiraceae bacterium]|nr:hypothetical protein [Lachnospiraceae bacterium]
MYVFLDVDGVLNTTADWARKVYSLDPECVKVFCRLLEGLADPKIVLSSTWRNGIARDGSTAVHIDELIQALRPAGITSIDRTGISPDGSRSREIGHYLKRHPADGYIILDDDEGLFEQKSMTPHLYLTSAVTGLTDSDVKLILKQIKIYERL